MDTPQTLQTKGLKTKGIRAIYNPDDEEKNVINHVYDRKRMMESSEDRQNAMKMCDKADRAWEAMREEKKAGQWQSNHYVPVTQAAVETAMSEYAGQMPRPFVVPRGTEDEPKVAIGQTVFDYSLECSNFDLNEYDVLHSGTIRGTAIAQEYYWQERRIIQDSILEKGKEVIKEEEVVDYDDCYTENVKLEDFFVDENARDFFGTYAARDCIRRYIMDIDDFKQFFSGDIWNPLNNAQYVKPGGDTNYYEWFSPPQGMDTTRQVEVLWYWAVKPKDWLIIVANEVLVKKGPNPYKHKRLPFVKTTAVRRPHSFYGKGLAEILESTQDEQNVLRRMIIDRNHLDIDKMFFVSNKLALSDEDLIARPHGMIPTDDVNAAKAIEYGDIPRSVELSLKHLEDDATISTGINPRSQALPQAGTATEAAILKESTLKRLQLIVWLHKLAFLIPLARLRMSNILQFYTQPRLEEVVGDAQTAEFKAEIAKLKANGLLVEQDDKQYKQTYRSVRLENKQLQTSADGSPSIQSAKGFSFFEALPKYYVPLHKLGYDFKFMAGATLQISKPLQQQKDLEWADRMLQIALQVPGSYDMVKIGDTISRSYDKDPNTLKPDTDLQAQAQAVRQQQQVQLADMENKMMIQGKEVPPTPYATPDHTKDHLDFMQGPEYQQMPNESPVTQIFINHVTGELAAQEQRQGGAPGQPPQAQPGQSGQPPTAPTSISQGIQNRPGGMAKPSTSMNNVLPGKNMGSGGASI